MAARKQGKATRKRGNETSTARKSATATEAIARRDAAEAERLTNTGRPPAEIAEEPILGEVEAAEPTAHEEKERETEESAPITTLEQLRDARHEEGAEPTTEEVKAVEELEQKTMEEGGELHRVPAAERGSE